MFHSMENAEGVATLSVGISQLQVHRGGRLVLHSVALVDSAGGSMIHSEGVLEATNCTIDRAVATINFVSRALEDNVPTVDRPPAAGAALVSGGAAVFVAGSSSRLTARGTNIRAQPYTGQWQTGEVPSLRGVGM